MKKILVLQHVSYEILGTLDPLLRGQSFRIRYINFARNPEAKPSLAKYDGLIVLGGPMNCDQTEAYPHLKTEIQLIKEALEKDIPILGVCLGAQLLAKALGAKVKANTKKEIGWYPIQLSPAGEKDKIFKAFQKKEQVVQWHGDTFEIPQDAVHLASSQLCPNQAFRYGDKVYGFQFHLEVDEPMIKRWLKVPGHLKELESLKGQIDPQEIKEKTPEYIGRLQSLSLATFGAFLKLFGVEKKVRLLPSR